MNIEEYREKLDEINPEFHKLLREYCITLDGEFFDLLEIFDGLETRMSLERLFYFCVQNERENKQDDPFDTYREALHKFYSLNKEKLPLWTEILKMRLL